jgi:hypothetical protein
MARKTKSTDGTTGVKTLAGKAKAAFGKSTAKKPSKPGRPTSRKPAKAAAARKSSGSKTSKPVAPEGEAPVAAEAGAPSAPAAEALAAEAPAAEAPVAENALPVFYRSPQPVSKERHAAYVIRRDANYGFAAQTNSVPLNAAEFPLAARHFPILFTGGEQAMGIALLGLRDDQNLFVGADGAWETGVYVPAYIRRYPFIFMEAGDDGRYILCLDENAEIVAPEGEGHKLFENGEPSEVATRALEFCKAYQQQSDYTRQLGRQLVDYGLLTANRANVTLKSGESVAVGGFRMIDGKALDALDETAFLELRRSGALPLIYAQMFSTANWAALAARDAARL